MGKSALGRLLRERRRRLETDALAGCVHFGRQDGRRRHARAFAESAALLLEFDRREVFGRRHEADNYGNAQEGRYEDGGEYLDGCHLKQGPGVADGEVNLDIQRRPAVNVPVDVVTSVAIS